MEGRVIESRLSEIGAMCIVFKIQYGQIFSNLAEKLFELKSSQNKKKYGFIDKMLNLGFKGQEVDIFVF